MEDLENKLEELLKQVDVRLIDCEYVVENQNNYFRVYIQAENGETNLELCENISKLIEKTCDEYIKDKYYLEVSTPGLERRLKVEKDFLKHIGELINIKTKNNIYSKKDFTGILKKFENDIVSLDEYEIPLSKIKTAKTVFDVKKFMEMEEKLNES